MYDLRDPAVQADCARRLGLGLVLAPAEPAAEPVVQQAAEPAASAPSWHNPAALAGKRGPAEKRPFRNLEVGQSFFIPPGPDQPKFSSLRVACIAKGKLLGRKFLCHEHEDGRFEVWRKS